MLWRNYAWVETTMVWLKAVVELWTLRIVQAGMVRQHGLAVVQPKARAVVMLLCLLIGLMLTACAPAATPVYPGQTWANVKSPESVGWSAEKLKQAQAYSESIGSTAVMIIANGEILAEWGDTTKKIDIRSMTKPLMNALYGIGVAEGKINLQSTLAELGVDDKLPPLTDGEKQARVVDLLRARSGVYHFSGVDTLIMRENMPEPGSHPPGTFWFYHNWDFCALGGIYEQTTQSSLFADFERLIAQPLGMEDFALADTAIVWGSYESNYPWYAFFMSARDLARFGLLYLRQGQWQGRQIVPQAWIAESIKPYSDASDWGRGGYGMLWWVTKEGQFFPNVEISGNAFAATGRGGDYLVIIPDLDLVVVHRTDPPLYPMVDDEQFGALLNLILKAKLGR